jgi:hypothetical protein
MELKSRLIANWKYEPWHDINIRKGVFKNGQSKRLNFFYKLKNRWTIRGSREPLVKSECTSRAVVWLGNIFTVLHIIGQSKMNEAWPDMTPDGIFSSSKLSKINFFQYFFGIFSFKQKLLFIVTNNMTSDHKQVISFDRMFVYLHSIYTLLIEGK